MLVLEGVEDECSEEVVKTRSVFASASANRGGGGREELLAVLGGVDGDFSGVLERSEWRGFEAVLWCVVEYDVYEGKMPWLR